MAKSSDKSEHKINDKFNPLNSTDPEFWNRLVCSVEPNYRKGDDINHITSRETLKLLQEKGFDKSPEGIEARQAICRRP